MAKKSTKKPEAKIKQRRNGRWAVFAKGGKVVNGEEKVKILAAAGKVKAPTAKKVVEEAEPAAAE